MKKKDEKQNDKLDRNDKIAKSKKINKSETNSSKSDALVWKICIVMSIAIVTALVIYLANKDMPVYKQDNKKSTYEVAKVLKVIEDKTEKDKNTDNIKKGTMTIKVKVLSGKYKNKTYTIDNYLSAMYNVNVKKGDKVSIRIDERNDGKVDVSVYNYYRVNSIIGCLIIFAIILIIVGGYKGFKALIG